MRAIAGICAPLLCTALVACGEPRLECESRAMRLKEIDLAEAATILIAVGDGALADSLRFSLGLEGFDMRLCDEPGCLVLDHEVFARMLSGNNEQ